jgi:transposase
VLDAFHVVKLAAQAMDEVRRRVQQDTLGHRGRAGDPLYRVRHILHRAASDLTDRQWTRLVDCLERGDPDDEVLVAWQCYQQVRSAYAADKPADDKQIAEQIVATFPNCPITEIARLGRTLRQWKDTDLGYFTTGGANNGGTEAVNGIIELHRRIARGYRNPDNYRLRMLLVTGGLLLPPDLR